MRKINLTEKIRGWNGEPLLIGGKTITVKNLLLEYVGLFESNKGIELILARKIGQKIFDIKEDFIEVEDLEWEIIKKSVYVPRHVALVMGPFLEIIEKIDRNE